MKPKIEWVFHKTKTPLEISFLLESENKLILFSVADGEKGPTTAIYFINHITNDSTLKHLIPAMYAAHEIMRVFRVTMNMDKKQRIKAIQKEFSRVKTVCNKLMRLKSLLIKD